MENERWEYSTKAVKTIFQNWYMIREERFHGKESAMAIFTDITRATKKVGLTNKQKAAIYEFYLKGLTEQEAAANLEISQQSLNQTITKAARNIASFLNGVPITNSLDGKRPIVYNLLDKGYTPKEAAAKAGVNVKTVYYWNSQRKKQTG